MKFDRCALCECHAFCVCVCESWLLYVFLFVFVQCEDPLRYFILHPPPPVTPLAFAVQKHKEVEKTTNLRMTYPTRNVRGHRRKIFNLSNSPQVPYDEKIQQQKMRTIFY